MTTTFYIVKHSQTEGNIGKVIEGQSDSPLTEEGRRQSLALADRLKDISFDVVLSSDTMSAFRTAEAKKPKLIIINGALGVGKTTLAKRYASEHPLTLQIDIDEVRRQISSWREEKEMSGMLSKQIACEMARTHLLSLHDVVVSQIFIQSEHLEKLEAIAQACGADFHEFLLCIPREEAVTRFVKRGQAGGYPDGFRPGGLVDLGGREKKVLQMYDDMMAMIAQRPGTRVIDAQEGNREATYQVLLESL